MRRVTLEEYEEEMRLEGSGGPASKRQKKAMAKAKTSSSISGLPESRFTRESVYPTALGQQQNKNEKRRTLFPRRRRRRGRGWRIPSTKQDYQQQTLGLPSSSRQRLRPLILILMEGRVTGPEAVGAPLRARALRPTTARGFWRVNTIVALF